MSRSEGGDVDGDLSTDIDELKVDIEIMRRMVARNQKNIEEIRNLLSLRNKGSAQWSDEDRRFVDSLLLEEVRHGPGQSLSALKRRGGRPRKRLFGPLKTRDRGRPGIFSRKTREKLIAEIDRLKSSVLIKESGKPPTAAEIYEALLDMALDGTPEGRRDPPGSRRRKAHVKRVVKRLPDWR